MLILHKTSGGEGRIKIWVDDLLLVAYPAFFWLVSDGMFHLVIIPKDNYFFFGVFFFLLKVSAASFTSAQAMIFMLMAINATRGTIKMLTPKDWLNRANIPAITTDTTAIAR